MSDLESLMLERIAIQFDFHKFEGKLNDWTHDLLANRIQMLDEMIEWEKTNA